MTGAVRGMAIAAFLALLVSGCSIPRWPVDGGAEVTSPFGIRWTSTLPAVHRGVDIRAPHGTPVRAMASGTVSYAGWMSGFGNVVWIEHRDNLLTIYAHLSEIRVNRGDPVDGREVVGLAGSTGTATGAHLHFEVWMNGRPVDPVSFLGRRP